MSRPLVDLDEYGHIVQIRRADGRPMLLDEATEFDRRIHGPATRWGTGLLSWQVNGVPVRGWRWHRADESDLTRTADMVRAVFRSPQRELSLTVTTTLDADDVRQRFVLTNCTDRMTTIGSWGISVPFRDTYLSAADSLARAAHAHLWTGGSDSYLWAAPTDGSGPGLGVVLTEGDLWSWSVEGRDANTSSNLRGRLLVHATDAARCPDPFAGEPISLAPGASHTFGWRIGWYDSLAVLHADREPLLDVDEIAATAGNPVRLRLAPGTELTWSGDLEVNHAGDGSAEVVANEPRQVDLYASNGARRSVTRLLFHPPLAEVVRRRCRYILDHQVWDGARFVPVDTSTGLPVTGSGWRDWNDLREREAMPILLQLARQHGLLDDADVARCDAVLAAHTAFLTEQVVDPDGRVVDDVDHGGTRLYNSPWFARWFLDRHEGSNDLADLELATRIVERYYADGGAKFLAFGLGGLGRRLAAAWQGRGDAVRAEGLEQLVVEHARTVLGFGDALPGHEVNYEQSMVAPLVDLLCQAHLIDPVAVPAEEIATRVRWLAAFAGDQPDVRLRHIPIRHWDGYWFGLRRQWGDVFPHYWSVLSADAFLALPDGVVPTAVRDDLRGRAAAILRSNLIAFGDDGSATCAHVYPSAVNGDRAHWNDPLANDQDWALVYALDHVDVVTGTEP